MDSSKERVFEFVVSGGDRAEVFEFVEKPFDEIALTIQREIRVSRFAAVGFGRNDRHNSALLKRADQGVGVVGFVGKERLGLDLSEQRFRLADVGRLAGRER